MPPFNLQNEILVLSLGTHHSNRLASADQQTVFDRPSLVGSVDINPATEVLAVKKSLESQLLRQKGMARCEQENGEEQHRASARHGMSLKMLKFNVWLKRLLYINLRGIGLPVQVAI